MPSPRPSPSQHPSLSGGGGPQVRECARQYLQGRKKGDAARLAHLGLAALADGAPRGPHCTTAGVRDGLRVFLVPLRPLAVGQDITWASTPIHSPSLPGAVG